MEKRSTLSFDFMCIVVMLFVVSLLFLPGILQGQTPIISHDFSSGTNGWTGPDGGPLNGWTRTNSDEAGFDNSGHYMRLSDFDNYGNNQYFSIESPEIDFSGYSNLNFSIDVRYKTARNEECIIEWRGNCYYSIDVYDGMNIEYSVNGGSWERLGNTGEGNWYNNESIEDLGIGWAGDNGGWQTAGIQLPAELIGQKVRFRVQFSSNGSGTDDGVAFDNVIITGTEPITFAPADGSAPGGIDDNLSLWLKADQEVKETNGVAFAWGDRSGNENHAFQADDTHKPQYISDALNGNPVVYFEEGPFMDGAAGFYTQQYFLVLDPNEIYNSTNAVGRIIGFEPGGFSHLAFGPSSTYSGTEIITHAVGYANGYRAFQEDDVSNYGNPSLIVSQNNRQSNPSAQVIYNNGFEVDTKDRYDFRNLNNQGYRLGDVFYWTSLVGDAPFNGRIAEVISYSQTLSSSDRRDVETYLAIKYGITLDISEQDYTVDGEAIYDNEDYAKDIAGIGKNLADQGLNQTASKSVNQGAIIRISNPSSLDNGDYLVWGNDGGPVSWIQTQVPAGNVDRFARTWHVRETGNVGTVNVSINLNQLGIDIDNSTVNLFQAPAGSSVPNTFSTATAHTNGVRSVNSEGQTIVTFQGIDFSNGEYFTIGGDIQTTSPGGVEENLSMWFKADGGVSLSGNSVKRWSDYSGNANDVYQGNQSLRPTYNRNEINFNPAIAFNNDYLDGIDGFYTQDYFVVAKPNSAVNRNNDQGALLGFESGENSALALGDYTGSFSNEIVSHYLNGGFGAAVTANNNNPLNAPLIINSKNTTGNQQEIYIDGLSKSNANRGSFKNLSNTELRIGSSYNGNPYSGQIAEVISYSSRLTDAKRRDVETYLAIKYGITLDISAQAYTAGGTSIYNYTTYSNNIAGIARDLDNGFNQPRSKSSNAGAIIEMGNASSMGNGDYLVWGKDGESTTEVQSTELPSEYDDRIKAEYRMAVTGNPGSVTVKIYVGGIQDYDRRSKTANFYSLLINQSNDFSSGNTVVAGSEIVNDTLVFHNVAFANGDYFTLAVPAIPSIGVNNTLWLRADKGLTLSSGSQVTAWADQSGEGNNAEPNGAGPLLVADYINGNDAIDFSSNSIEGNRGFYTREYFVVADPDGTYSSTSNDGYLVGFESGNNGLVLGRSVNNWTDEVLTHYRGSNRTALRGTTSFSNPTLFNSANNNGNASQALFVDAAAQAVSSSGFTNLNNQPYRIGNSYNNGGAFNGKIAEVLSFSTTQSAAQKRNIETYLALKYGISLDPAGGNYTLEGTEVFNVSNFSGYTNNVIGIASFAKYDFLQTTARSTNSSSVVSISNASSLNNNDFLIIGNNGGAMTSTTAGVPANVGERVQRKWAVQTTNTPGTVTLSFDLSGLGYGAKTSNDFSLILDTNSNFSDGISSLVTPSSWSGQVVTFTNVNLSDIKYFGLGTAIDLVSDSDTDGIPNYFEIAYGTNPNNGNHPVNEGSPYTDTNSSTGINADGISDALERILIDNGATGPVSRYTDTDKDGIPDWIEVKNGTSPYNANSPTANGGQDTDGDGLPNALEVLIAQMGGAANAGFTTDTDGDGVPDFLEIVNNTSPNNGNQPVITGGVDSDGDGVTNAMEATIQAGGATGVVNKDSDTDDDGIPDYIEAITYTDPFNQASPWVPASLNIRTSNADFSVTNTCVEISGHQWINVLDDNGRLVFSINAVGNNLGATCYGVRILRGKEAVRTNGTHYIMNRNWWITPATQPTGEKVYIRFYAQGQEMADLWGKSVDVGIITPETNEEAFNRDYVRFTKIANLNTLDALAEGGERTVLTPKLLPFSGNNRMFTVGVDGFSSFVPYASGNPDPLPVTLLFFKGQSKNQSVELSWATASETNNDYFVVERSVDGINFDPLSRTGGAGNSATKLEYSTVDDQPLPGISYYRLKQVDFDGKYSYSELIHVEVTGLENSVRIYPNPAQEEINLQFNMELQGLMPLISLYDVSGRKCGVNARQVERNKFVLNLNSLDAGAYLVEVLYGQNKMVKLIIKE